MGVRHPKREELSRLGNKSLDAQFCAILRDGLNCSPFEARAMLFAVNLISAATFQPQRNFPLASFVSLRILLHT